MKYLFYITGGLYLLSTMIAAAFGFDLIIWLLEKLAR
jgi:hypothetical protein